MTPVPLPWPARETAPMPGRGCDCRRCAYWTGPDGNGGPATVEPLCSGCNADCSYCGCSAAEASAPQRACAQCPIRCPSRTDIAAWMRDTGGTLAFGDITLTGRLPAGWPRFVPQVDGSAVTDLDAGLGWPAYGVGLRRVFSPEARAIYPRFAGHDAHQVLDLKPGTRAVLIGYGEDPLVEAFWTRRHADKLITQIAGQGWNVVLTPNYSVYGNWPRIEHLINMRRSLMVAAEFNAAGMVAVPNIYWYRLEDLRRWADWAAAAEPPAIAINAQTVRENTNWESWMLPGLTWLAENLPAELPVIITGLSRTDRITTAAGLLGTRLTVISQNPHQYALHGAVMTADGRQDIHARTGDAFRTTVTYMASLLPGGTP